MNCSPPGSSVHGILQARILEWVVMPFLRESSQPRDQTHVSYVSCLGRWIVYLSCHLGSPVLKPFLDLNLHQKSKDGFLYHLYLLHNLSLRLHSNSIRITPFSLPITTQRSTPALDHLRMHRAPLRMIPRAWVVLKKIKWSTQNFKTPLQITGY